MVLCITGTILISIADNPWFLVLARFLAGSAAAFCLLSILRLAIQWFPAEKMGQVSGTAITIGMIGGAVSQAPLTWLINLVGWRMALRDVAVLGVVFLILIFFWVKDAPPEQAFSEFQTKSHHLSLWQNFQHIIHNSANWLTAFFIATMNLPIMLLAGLFGTQFMVQSYGFSQIEGSSISMMIFIGTIVGSTLVGWWSDLARSRRRPMLLFAWLSLAIFLFILYGPRCGMWGYIVLFFLLGLTTAAQIIGYPVTRELNPSSLSGSSLGFISVIIMGLPVLLQPLTGYLMGFGHPDGFLNYNLNDYRRGLVILVIGFVISIVTAWKVQESYGVKVDEI
jgi:predicted MFS family arabinose efflux permease